MSWMAEMSSYRYLGELKRRCSESDAAAERPSSEPEPRAEASAHPDAAATDSRNPPTAAHPLESASSTA
jgi:hypothetical protein